MSRTSNVTTSPPTHPQPRELTAEEIGALVDPDLAPHLADTLEANLPAGTLTVDLIRSVDDRLQAEPVPFSARVELIAGLDGDRLALRCHEQGCHEQDCHERGCHEREGDSAIVWIHGGGLFLGRADRDDPVCAALAGEHGATVVAVDYRLAPEHPYPAALEDCYAALTWTSQRYERVVVVGESAGGGLAAALTLLARDRRGPSVTAQVLHYPMLDDRGETISARTLACAPVWNRTLNELGWRSYLAGQEAAGQTVDAYAAPARAGDLSGLPPTYLEVGALDLFRDEGIAFATALTAAGVPTELHVDAGAVHGFDRVAPDAGISRVARERRARFARRYLTTRSHSNGAQ
jgi:acetyl esterase/lipase